MKKNNEHHCILYRLRKQGLRIDTTQKIIYYEYANPEQEKKMKSRSVKRLCNEFGFARQSEIPTL
ncbi:hypothetical protein M2135_001088 [Parabacteroides sp. PF5-9]|nr:hypothetical protein [Parabacteroides sp. PF5-9]